jgi:hypothetical protein
MATEIAQSIARIGRLHPVYAGVYAVGRKELSRHGAATPSP